MKIKKIISVILAASISVCSLIGIGFSANAGDIYNITINAVFGQSEARSILDMINEFRTGDDAWYWNNDNETITECKGLSELQYDYKLEEIAMQRAAEIAVMFSHTRPDGKSLWTAYSENGFTLSAVVCGENIAAGYANASEVNEAWREDFADSENQNHRRNLLNKSYKSVGIGHAYYNGYHFWVEEFSGRITDTSYTKPVDYTKECSIKLSADYITDIKLQNNTEEISIDVGETITLPKISASAKINSKWNQLIDNEAAEINVAPLYTVQNSSIAQLNDNKITGISEGTTEITAVINGETATIPITVKGSAHQHTAEWTEENGILVKKCNECTAELKKLQFTDLSRCVAYGDYVEYTSSFNQFITGTNPPARTLFSPTTPITRAMFITILYRMAGEPYKNANPYNSSPFTDITNTSVYYYDAACWALDNKITTQTTFKPYDNVSREQTASFLFRYANENGYITDDAYKKVNLSVYHDYNNIRDWSKEAMQWANYNGMITGTQQGYANPQGSTQRIHATKILYGFGKTCNIGNFE